MVRDPTLCELAALDVLTRQLDAIKRQFRDERLARRRDADPRDAARLGRDPFRVASDLQPAERAHPLGRRQAGRGC